MYLKVLVSESYIVKAKLNKNKQQQQQNNNNNNNNNK